MSYNFTSYNPEFPPEAQAELQEYLGSQRIPSRGGPNRRVRNLRRLLTIGDGSVVVPNRLKKSVQDQLIHLGI